jgi:hypothetical protein
MNQYTYLLYSENTQSFQDISKYVQTNAGISDRYDTTLDFGSFTIAHIKSDTIDGFDMSEPIKPWTPIIINVNNGEEIYRMYTGDSTRSIVKKSSPKLYKHEINLIEASKALWRKPISDMTITQPKSLVFQGAYYSENYSNDEEIQESIYPEIVDDNVWFDVVLETERQSSDTNLIEDNTAKSIGRDYKLNLTIDVTNKQFNDTQFNWNPLRGNIGF